MASIFNEQRVVGVRKVADGTLIFNNQPVIGLSVASNGVLFSSNKRTLGVDVLDADKAVHNERAVIGYVLIEDGRKLYNGREVIPAWAVTGDLSTGGVSGPYPAPTGYRWDYVVSGSEMVVSNNEPVVTLVRMN